jgi:hypothetical protein
MSVILGSDGAIQFDFGSLLCTANTFAWTVNLGRETLPTTKQGDYAVSRTGGLADHTGSVSIRLQFSDDDSQANSAWQILQFAIGNHDDDLKAGIRLYLQRTPPPAECDDVLGQLMPDAVFLGGTVVVTSISLDCSDPGEPVVAVVNWEADGGLDLFREAP